MRRPLLLLPTLLGVAACGDANRSTGPVMGNAPSFAISDGANTGGGPANGDFFFLPPLVPNPSGSLTYDAGAFDATLSPRVAICKLTAIEPRICAAEPFRIFSGDQIAVSTTDEQYQVNWHTDVDNLETSELYRIQVQLPRHSHDGVEHWNTLGFADVDPVSSGKELKNVATGQYIGLVDGRTLPIKFRIERSPRCLDSDDCVEAIVSDEGGRVETESGYAIAEFREGWLPDGFDEVVVAIRRVPIGGPGQDASCHGTAHVQYEGCYDFETFPDVGTFAIPAVISTCIEPDAGAREPFLQLAASDGGDNFRLLPPQTVTIECDGFTGTTAPIGFLGRLGGRVLAIGSRLGLALAPRALYAVDKGRGGTIDGFSHGGWVLPVTVEAMQPEGENPVAAPASAVPVSVMVRSAHESNASSSAMSGLAVTFSLAAGGGTVSAPVAVTNSDGVASTTWTLGTILGKHVLTASVGGAQVGITVTVSEPEPLTLTFDTGPDGAAIEPGTVVNGTYASLGVTLRRIGQQQSCATESENVYANDHGAGGFGSGQNNITVCPEGTASDFGEAFFGRIEGSFARPASRSCIDVAPTSEGGVGFLEAYGIEGLPLGRAESQPGVTETICVEAEGIRSVQFSGEETLLAIFDNLSVLF